jgi:hypothetical protein
LDPKKFYGIRRITPKEATKANPEKMEKTDHVIAVLEQMIAMMKANREKTEATDLKANPEEMESESEHGEVPKKGRKQQQSDWHLAAGRCEEPKELTREVCGSRRKLAAACRKVSHRVTVARSKRNVFRKIRTLGNCGPQMELDISGMRMTHLTKVARSKLER